jgi:hypothetical protein
MDASAAHVKIVPETAPQDSREAASVVSHGCNMLARKIAILPVTPVTLARKTLAAKRLKSDRPRENRSLSRHSAVTPGHSCRPPGMADRPPSASRAARLPDLSKPSRRG